MFDILNEDFTTYEAFEPFLKKAVSKGREILGGSVVQIQHILNISVAKQDGPQQYDPERQIIKVTLTDGDSTIYGLVAEPIPRLNLNTPPGTKLKIVQTTSTHGQIILLTRNNTQILGGDVPKLIEKWNFQRALDIKKEWGAVGKIEGTEGPPIWRAFGQKSVPLDVALLRKMKAMDIVNEKKDAEGGDGSNKTQFDQQRTEAITELMEKSVKQKWQKPNKHLVTKEVQEIIDEGFTYDEASNAMDRFKNQQKALRYLKSSRGEYPPTRSAVPSEDRKEKKRKGGKGDEDEDDYTPIPKEYQRPTNNISLFGFIAGPMNIKGGPETVEPASSNTPEYENSSYGSRGGRGGRGRGGRGRGGRGSYENSSSSTDYAPSSRGSYRGGRGGERGTSSSNRGYSNNSRESSDTRVNSYRSNPPPPTAPHSQDVRSYGGQPPPRYQSSNNTGENYNSSYPSNSMSSQYNNRYPSAPPSGGGNRGVGRSAGGYNDYEYRGNSYGGGSSDSWNQSAQQSQSAVFTRSSGSDRGGGGRGRSSRGGSGYNNNSRGYY